MHNSEAAGGRPFVTAAFKTPKQKVVMRLGIFGGSFDPIHVGHLILAEQCREHARLDEVWFLPASTPPHKRDRELVSAKQRTEMLELAVHGNGAFSVSNMELDRGGVSYTVDTLTTISEMHPDSDLFFMMGADSLTEFPTWREPARILELATPLVVARGGEPKLDFQSLAQYTTPERLFEIVAHEVRMPLLEISSSRIRQDVAQGRSIRYRVPRAVEQYISTHELYK